VRAQSIGAEAERLHLLRRVLELWAKVDDAPTVATVDRLTVLDHAVEASLATSAVAAGLSWSAEALALAPAPRRYLHQARLKNLGSAGGHEDLLQALVLSDEDLLRGEILAELAAGYVFAGEALRGAQEARAALEIAERLGDARLAARAHSYLGLAEAADLGVACKHFAAARAAADPPTMIAIAIWEAAARHAFGQHADAIEVIQLGLRTAHKTFQYALHAPILVVKWVQALTALGRRPEALELIDETLGEPDLPRLSHAALLISRGEIQLAQGNASAALAAAGGAEKLLGDEPWVRKYRLRLRTLQIRLAPGQAAEIYAATLAAEDLAAHPHEAWPLLAAAAPAELPDVPVIGPVDEAYRAMATGDLPTAARIWDELGQPDELSRCRPQPAAARQPKPPKPPSGLTARELEVLTLVAEGKSNRQIAAELFISGNTAGVHVSRILAKLGAATRTEAARKLFDTTQIT
jgi:DNA-binding CsgD family transcriptional regulator